MPQLKPPMRLRDQVMQLVDILLVRICRSWIEILLAAAQTGRDLYFLCADIVQIHSNEIHGCLTEVPKHILEDFIPKLARRFLDMITEYDERNRQLQLRIWNEETHNTVCKGMLRSLLTRTTERYDTLGIASSFAQSLVIQTLDSVPRLTVFCLDTQVAIDHSALLATKIRHLPKLRVFQYEYHCTDEVIKQLRLHCPDLMKINFRYSNMITNGSVHHLMELRQLLFVHFEGAELSSASYALLLSELPSILNIEFWASSINVLRHIRREILDTILYVKGYVRNINILTQKCPNIRTLNMYWLTEDMTSVRALTALRSLQITNGDYGMYNLNTVLQDIGHRLTELRLKNTVNVNINDMVTLCSGLECLVLEICRFLPLRAYEPLDPQLPHFKSLISLTITKRPDDNTDFRYLRHYVNLKTIECRGVYIFTHDFVSDCVNRGRFRNLERFHINEAWQGGLTMQSIELLIQHCEHLKSVGYLATWANLNPFLIRDLNQSILFRNFDLEILLLD
jgi:hypothetical protein